MMTVEVSLPIDLIRLAGLSLTNASVEASHLLALSLYKENRVSLARAVELCDTTVGQFLEFASRVGDPLPYGPEQLEEDCRALEKSAL